MFPKIHEKGKRKKNEQHKSILSSEYFEKNNMFTQKTRTGLNSIKLLVSCQNIASPLISF